VGPCEASIMRVSVWL